MISISGKEWKEYKTPRRLIDKYSSDFDISENLSKLTVGTFFLKGQNDHDHCFFVFSGTVGAAFAIVFSSMFATRLL